MNSMFKNNTIRKAVMAELDKRIVSAQALHDKKIEEIESNLEIEIKAATDKALESKILVATGIVNTILSGGKVE